MQQVKIKDTTYVRDMKSKAILATDRRDIREYKEKLSMKLLLKKQDDKLNVLQQQIDTLNQMVKDHLLNNRKEQ